MSVDSLLAWREPVAGDWRAQTAQLANDLDKGSLEDLDAVARRLRRLSGMRLSAGERLHLCRLVSRARSLPKMLPGFRPFRLLLVSNRTTSFIARDLECAGAARGLLIEAVEIDYDSVHSFALSPESNHDLGPLDGAVLLVDDGFFFSHGDLLDDDAETTSISTIQSQLAELIGGLRRKVNAPVIATTIARPPELQLSSADVAIAGSAVRKIKAINNFLAESGKNGQVVVFDLEALASRIGSLEFFDPTRFHHAKIPFSLDASPVVADALAALVAAMIGRAGRALVLDLDNTLWGGIIADDGLEGIIVGQGSAEAEAFLAVQRHALELRRRGIVLAVLSKNLEDIAREPFRSHPDMLIRQEHVSTFVANFDDKATNIVRIAQTLDLDTSSLVFLDDNPAERERVRSSLPFVMVPEIGNDPAHYVRELTASGFFEQLLLTPDDLRRATAYQARAEAKALRASVGDYETYLRSLQMQLTISSFDVVGRSRITQLVQKSNQFNLTTKRYTDVEISEIETAPDRLGWQVRLKDRFADHGMISALVIEKAKTSWKIDNWVMSCRVLERGVEAAIIQELAKLAAKEGANELLGIYRPTARNKIVEALYDRLGFQQLETLEPKPDGAKFYCLKLADLNHQVAAIQIVSAPQPRGELAVVRSQLGSEIRP